MSKPDKLLERMRKKPHDGWSIEDVCTICDQAGVMASPPKRGSHYKISHPDHVEILTVPARRPIKSFYIRKLVTFIGKVIGETCDD
jgi:predicted RNA binding protein YcfA (HicA-like mRNA interferase family)